MVYPERLEKRFNDLNVNWMASKQSVMNACKVLSLHGFSQEQVLDECMDLFCVAKWRDYRVVYDFDKSLAEILLFVETEKNIVYNRRAGISSVS